MTTRKPKPRKAAVRKGSKPTLEVRMETAEAFMGAHSEAINQLHQRIAALEKIAHPPVYNHVPEICARLDALETRGHFRDASHDEPVSNAGEAVGQHFTIISDRMMKVATKRGGWRWAWWRL